MTKQVKINIGSGKDAGKGFIGIDNSLFSTANHMLDLNKDKLPFEDNSVDYIYSSHCLEHLKKEGFLHIIKEMYRVAKPNSQIYISVPYYNSNGTQANIFHLTNIFNEHTFRFFSSELKTTALPEEEYVTTSGKVWGLRGTGGENINIELKTLSIDFRYFPKYRNLSLKDKFEARNSSINVVEFILYHLMVIKPAPTLMHKNPVDHNDYYHTKIKEYIISNPSEKIIRQDNLYNMNGLLYPAIEMFKMIEYRK